MAENGDSYDLIEALPALAAPVRAGAIKAFSQLIGGFGSYLTAWMRRPTQSVDDKTDAISLITKRVAEAAAKRAEEDDALIDRALQNWLPQELRKHENKLSVVDYTLEELKAASENDTTLGSNEDLDQDWLNSFERFAEDASSEHVRRLWAKVLSGEIIKPGSFSRSTLRFIYELDRSTAHSFELAVKHVINDQVFTGDDNQELFTNLLVLEAVGVVSGVGGLIQSQLQADKRGLFSLTGREHGIVGLAEPNAIVGPSVAPLTRVGAELIKIVPNPDEKLTLIEIANGLKKPTGFPQTEVKGVALCSAVIIDGNSRLRLIENIWGVPPFDALKEA